MPDTRNELNRIMPAILAALSNQRRPDRPIKVAFAPNGHIEAIVTLCDDGPVISMQNEPGCKGAEAGEMNLPRTLAGVPSHGRRLSAP